MDRINNFIDKLCPQYTQAVVLNSKSNESYSNYKKGSKKTASVGENNFIL